MTIKQARGFIKKRFGLHYKGWWTHPHPELSGKTPNEMINEGNTQELLVIISKAAYDLGEWQRKELGKLVKEKPVKIQKA